RLPTGFLVKTQGAPHCQRNDEERRSLAQRVRSIDRCEGAECRKPEGAMRRSPLESFGCNPARYVCQKEAAQKFQRDLNPRCRCVIFHAEELETRGKEERIPGQANQGWIRLTCADRERVSPAHQEVFGDGPVDQRVASDLKKVLEHPKTKESACQKG